MGLSASAQDGQRSGILHQFGSNGRVTLGALSYVNFQARNRKLLVQAFHTFPEDCAIVKASRYSNFPSTSSEKFLPLPKAPPLQWGGVSRWQGLSGSCTSPDYS